MATASGVAPILARKANWPVTGGWDAAGADIAMDGYGVVGVRIGCFRGSLGEFLERCQKTSFALVRTWR